MRRDNLTFLKEEWNQQEVNDCEYGIQISLKLIQLMLLFSIEAISLRSLVSDICSDHGIEPFSSDKMYWI